MSRRGEVRERNGRWLAYPRDPSGELAAPVAEFASRKEAEAALPWYRLYSGDTLIATTPETGRFGLALLAVWLQSRPDQGPYRIVCPDWELTRPRKFRGYLTEPRRAL